MLLIYQAVLCNLYKSDQTSLEYEFQLKNKIKKLKNGIYKKNITY